MGDWFEILNILLIPLVGLILGYFLGRYSRQQTQNRGEAIVRQLLLEYCKNRDAHVLNNVTLRLTDGSTTQIDHILVARKGIFVIETKHYNGWIFADSKSKFWTQIIYFSKFRFQNPLNQNYRHIKAIQYHLDFIEPQHIHSIIVFTGEAVFKTAKPENVCYRQELIPKIEKHLDESLSLNRVQFCVGRLEYMRLELTQETDIEHNAFLVRKFGR